MTPRRIQAAPSWVLPDNTTSVATGPWANPYQVGGPDQLTRRQALGMYRSWLSLHPELVWAARIELAGRDLACTCSRRDPYCHAEVLLEVANTTDAWPLQPMPPRPHYKGNCGPRRGRRHLTGARR